MNTQHILFNILYFAIAYLIGSIPSSVWIGKIFYGKDVRDYGSGNAGATNTFRVLGFKPGIIVFLFDVLKGFAALHVIYFSNYYIPETGKYINFQLLLGLAALIGHIYPVFAQFRGGKGVATMLGIVFALHPYAALTALGIWIITLAFTKYVSLASMASGFSFPILLILVFQVRTQSLAIFSITVAILLFVTHQKNIERLLKREESKIILKKKKEISS